MEICGSFGSRANVIGLKKYEYAGKQESGAVMKKSFIYIFVFITFLSLAGCGATGTAITAKEAANDALLQKPGPGSAIVYIHRAYGHSRVAREFTAYLDGKDQASEMGSTYSGQYIYFYVTPGKHIVYTEAPDNWDEITIYAKEQDVIFLSQNAAIKGIIAGVKMELLSENEGRSRIRDSELGTITRYRKKM